MGMANSDNENEIYRRHAREEHMKTRPRASYFEREHWSEEDRAYYLHDLEAWANGFDDTNYQDYDRR